jgi:DNA-binding NtrC family response regulator
VGGSHEEPVDVRIIFATHRNLEKMVQEGKFREDLYYRIHVVELHLPPLRERVEDIAPLVDHFLSIFAARYKRDRLALSREALRRLASHAWPGNVRQLEHVLLNAWVLSDGPTLEATDFEFPDGTRTPVAAAPAQAPSPSASRSQSSHHRSKQTLSKHRRDERDRILQALQASNWNRVKAAELSGIPRRTFYRRLREYGIQ